MLYTPDNSQYSGIQACFKKYILLKNVSY